MPRTRPPAGRPAGQPTTAARFGFPALPSHRPRETERWLQDQVQDALTKLNWTAYHTWTSLHSARGFPDVLACRPPRVLAIELKSAAGTLSPWQEHWAALLAACPGVEYYCLRPADWHSGRIEELLR
jgi:hypothetical protein